MSGVARCAAEHATDTVIADLATRMPDLGAPLGTEAFGWLKRLTLQAADGRVPGAVPCERVHRRPGIPIQASAAPDWQHSISLRFMLRRVRGTLGRRRQSFTRSSL